MPKRGDQLLIEYLSGWLLRGLMGFLFVLGLLGLVAALVAGTITTQLLNVPLMMLPYLVIRYRDPNMATIPYLIE